jgi:hypothetical protein
MNRILSMYQNKNCHNLFGFIYTSEYFILDEYSNDENAMWFIYKDMMFTIETIPGGILLE